MRSRIFKLFTCATILLVLSTEPALAACSLGL